MECISAWLASAAAAERLAQACHVACDVLGWQVLTCPLMFIARIYVSIALIRFIKNT